MTTSEILKSIADDTRLSIIRKLANERADVACTDIVNDCSIALGLSQPTMSHHFSRLVQTGVITETRLGKTKLYRLNFELLEKTGVDPYKL